MAMVFSFRDLLAERRASALTARANAWDEFQRTVRALRTAQDAMDAAHREYIRLDNLARGSHG